MATAPTPEDSPDQMVTAPYNELDANLNVLYRIAKMSDQGSFYKMPIADATLILLMGQEMGLKPTQALRSIHVIKGKPTMSADLMAGVALASDACEYFLPVEMTATKCTYRTKRKGSPEEVVMTWTMEDAKRAQLLGNPNWKKYPQAMLKARVVAQLARAVYPDILMGVYVEGELEDERPMEQVHPPVEDVIDAQYVEHDQHESALDLTKELIQEVHGAVNDTDAADLFLEGLCTKWKVERLEHAPLELLRKTLDAFAATTPEKRSAIIMAAKPQPQGDIEGMGKSARKMSGEEQSLRLATRLKSMVQRCEDEGLITPLQAESFEGFVCDKAGVGLLEEVPAEKLSRWCDRLECADGETCDLKKRSGLILDSIP